MNNYLIVGICASIVFFVLYLVLERMMEEKRYNQEIENIITSEQNKVKSRFE